MAAQAGAIPEALATVDVAIVGGGVIGMACAEALSREHLRVAVIERDQLGRAASWAGGGMLTPLPPDQCPDAIRDLLAESLRLFPEWCARLQRESGIDPEYWACGAEYWKQDQCIDYPTLAQVRNPRLLQALAGTLRARGVTIIEQAPANGWLTTGGVLHAVQTRKGAVQCRAAVLAAGAWSAPRGAAGIAPAKGQMLLLQAPPGRLPKMLIDDEVYLIPRRDGHILVGSTVEDAGFDLSVTTDARELLLSRAARRWREVREWPVVRHWAGLRPRPAGAAPLIGSHPEVQGLYLATGHFRIGLTLSPATAARIAALVTTALAGPAGSR